MNHEPRIPTNTVPRLLLTGASLMLVGLLIQQCSVGSHELEGAILEYEQNLEGDAEECHAPVEELPPECMGEEDISLPSELPNPGQEPCPDTALEPIEGCGGDVFYVCTCHVYTANGITVVHNKLNRNPAQLNGRECREVCLAVKAQLGGTRVRHHPQFEPNGDPTEPVTVDPDDPCGSLQAIPNQEPPQCKKEDDCDGETKPCEAGDVTPTTTPYQDQGKNCCKLEITRACGCPQC